MNIGQLIHDRRTALGLTFEEVGNIVGVSKSTVKKWESGNISNMRRDKIASLAKALKISPVQLVVENTDTTDRVVPVPLENVYMCPVYNSVAAGFNVLAQDTVIDYIPTLIRVPSEQDLYIWANVIGDSMSPKIEEGDSLLIKRQESVDSGSIAVVLIDDEEASVKKVIYDTDWIELRSINPYYPPRRFEGAEVQRIRVVGLVKKVLKDIN